MDMSTRIAGILNLTPDSFYPESRHTAEDDIRITAQRMQQEGADMLDIGACSTKPGSVPVSAGEEISRFESGIPQIADMCPSLALSIDTFRPEVAAFCAGKWRIAYINDISGGSEEMFHTVADSGSGYILTYNRPVVGNVVEEMMQFFTQKIPQLRKAGVRDIILDPGFGFAKNLSQNYEILANLRRTSHFGLPVMAGISRKSMAYIPTGSTPEQSLDSTIALNALAIANGAEWLRVHDVKEAVHTAVVADKLNMIKGN